MNERRRFLEMLGGSVLVGAGCAAPQPLGVGGATSAGGGGAAGTGGAGGATSASTTAATSTSTSTSTSATASTTATASSSGGDCGTGGAVNEGSNADVCQSSKGRFAVGMPADYPTVGFNKVSNTDAGILMLRDAGGLYALSALCTHNCCDMNVSSSQGPNGTPTTFDGKPVYRCNCHGSKFYTDGTVAHGPAQEALASYELSLGCDGKLYVDTGKTVPSSTRLVV